MSLGIAPYLNFPGYSEFRIGDYQHELGLIDSRFAPVVPAPSPPEQLLTGMWTMYKPLLSN
nr:hypothetical protein [Haliscomenobacter sp.]